MCHYYPPTPQSSTRGTVNGIGQSLVAISRSIGPLIGAPLFAWSASNGKGILQCHTARIIVCHCSHMLHYRLSLLAAIALRFWLGESSCSKDFVVKIYH